MPILMLAGSDAEADVVRGLEAGANDYMVKPVRPGELLARLRAQLRSFESSEHAVFTIGPYTFPAHGQAAARPGQEPAHPPHRKEVGILRLLFAPGARP